MSAASDHAYQVIRSRILEGVFEPGMRLKEGELSDICEVSRTPVREALRRLSADGLVLITPNSGAIVSDWDEEDVADIYQVRMHLEALAAQFAAERRTDEQLARLEALAREMLEVVIDTTRTDTDIKMGSLNSEFHHLIITAANSKALSAAAAQVVEAPLMMRTFRRYGSDRLKRSASDHMELVAAIRAQDGQLADSIMRAHILSGLKSLLTEE